MKITDFGFSKIFTDDKLVTAVGSPNYAAPELFMGKKNYKQAIDMWSLGVLIYVVLSGYTPFYAKTLPDLSKQIMNGRFGFPDTPWQDVSESAQELICQLIVVNPSERMSSGECLTHTWLQQGFDEEV